MWAIIGPLSWFYNSSLSISLPRTFTPSTCLIANNTLWSKPVHKYPGYCAVHWKDHCHKAEWTNGRQTKGGQRRPTRHKADCAKGRPTQRRLQCIRGRICSVLFFNVDERCRHDEHWKDFSSILLVLPGCRRSLLSASMALIGITIIVTTSPQYRYGATWCADGRLRCHWSSTGGSTRFVGPQCGIRLCRSQHPATSVTS